jgi:hypothetical protein
MQRERRREGDKERKTEQKTAGPGLKLKNLITLINPFVLWTHSVQTVPSKHLKLTLKCRLPINSYMPAGKTLTSVYIIPPILPACTERGIL